MNGSLYRFFKGRRGLRQGDPLSPYVFVLWMEYLARGFRQVSQQQGFYFHPKCKKDGIVTLNFADDLMVMSKRHSQSLLLIKLQLNCFEKVL